MKDKIRFYITDVFGFGRYSGNPLAVFMDCEGLSGEEMQAMAREINFSESTFILSSQPQDGAYSVRIFTPGSEVDFAGHPTLGTAAIIQQHLLSGTADEVLLNLKVGRVPVTFAGAGDGVIWMKQVTPIFGATLDRALLAGVVGLELADLDARFPVMEVSTGLPQIIIPLKSMAALKRARVNRELFWQYCPQWWAKSLLLFCPEGYSAEQQLGVRVFVDYYRIPEDPATGSGNGCLAAYLVKHRYFNTPQVDIRVGQGYEIGRPSQLYLSAREEDGVIHVSVGGRVIPIADGWWG